MRRSIRVLYHKIGIDVGAELRAIEYSDVPPTASSDDPNFLAYARHEISISTVKSNGQTNILRRQSIDFVLTFLTFKKVFAQLKFRFPFRSGGEVHYEECKLFDCLIGSDEGGDQENVERK